MLRLLLKSGSLYGCAILLACGTTQGAPAQSTWMVDCVSVLGIPTPSGQMPLDAIPLTGLPRGATIGELTDVQLARLADWGACLFGNGYRHDCCSSTSCPSTVAGDPPIGPFRLETTPLLASEVSTCYATTPGESQSPSREGAMDLLRNTYGACHLGLYEDCMRGYASATFGAVGVPAVCTEYNNLCGAL